MKFTRLFLAAGLAAALVGSARAADTNHGDYAGPTVQYTDITESTVTDPLPLFGAPVGAGDSIVFNPVSYNSSAVGPGGSDNSAGTISAMIEALAFNYITDLSFSEAGDYSLVGAGSAATTAAVTGSVTVTVSEVDGAAIAPVVIVDALAFSPSNGDWNLQDDGPGIIVQGIWNGGLDLDVKQALIDAGVAVNWGASKLTLEYANDLSSTSESGTTSLIAKKDVVIGATTAVPEPGAFVLAACAGLAFIGFRRK